jgi:MFS family permease
VSRIAVDVRPLRESRDFALLTAGTIVTGIGNQAALIALPYQVFVLTGSAFLTGLLGLAELGPLMAASLFAGALADRFDRRQLLLGCQLALVLVAAGLAMAAETGSPPVWLLFVLAAIGGGFAAVERVVRSAIVPNVVEPDRIRAAVSLTFGLFQVSMVVGPALGGILISAFGIAVPYWVDSASCLGMAGTAWAMTPQPPIGVESNEPVLVAIRRGLGFMRRTRALLGSLLADLGAMTFGMPRALFPVLSITAFDAGAAGTGLLAAAVSAGGVIGALTTGWLESARFLGRIVLGAIAVWGVAVAIAGIAGSIWLAAALFAVAGTADSVSAVCRHTMSQLLTPDRMRGRMSSVFHLVTAGGPQLGDVESGLVASAVSPRFSVVSGGLACLAIVGVTALAFPELMRYDAGREGARPAEDESGFEVVQSETGV